MKRKKAQITLFIIIGLVIVGAVAFLYYFITTPRIEKKELDTTAIEEYVTSCLDKTAKQALIKLGEQGGYLFVQDMPKSKRIGEIEIAYLITAPRLISTDEWQIYDYLGSNPFPSDWKYPWENFPYKNGEEVYTGYFGNDNVPGLESGEISFKMQLKKFIEKNVTSCLDLSIFKEKGFNIKVTSPPQIDIVITNENVIFTLNLGLNVKKSGSKKKINNFVAVEDVKLRNLYQFLKTLIFNDITDISFDITKQVPIYTITKSEQANDDLIIITDSSSIVNGKPYLFQFMRENRKPALHNNTISCDNLELNVNYFDPDEDNLAFCNVQDNSLVISDGSKQDSKPLE